MVLASVFVVAVLLTAVLVWPSGSKTQLTTETGGPTTTDASIADPSTTFESATSDDVASTTTASSGRKPAGPRPTTAPATSESLVPAGFLLYPQFGSVVGIARFDYTGQRRLFAFPVEPPEGWAAWSPARDKIAVSYCASYEECTVRTVSIDGEVSPPLGNGFFRLPNERSWSPDGRWIVVERTRSDPELSLVPVDGGATRRVGGGSSTVVAWSPDSKRIAFVKSEVLHISNVDGTNDRTFPDPMKADSSRDVFGAKVVAWAPDGRTLAVSRRYFVKAERDPQNEGVQQPTATTAILDPASGSWHELGDWDFYGDWTHDSAAVLVRVPKYWNHITGARGCPGNTDVFALNVTTGARRSFGTGCSMGLSPDGKHVWVAEMAAARVVPLAGADPEGRVVYVPDEQHGMVGFSLVCCEWSPGSDAIVVGEHGTVVRIDGRGRWDPPPAS